MSAMLYSVPAKLRVPPSMLEGVSFSRGQKIKIRVPIVGRPLPKVMWSVDGEVIEPGDKYEVTCTDTSATLVVHDSEKTDSGQYTIHVENELGQDFVSFPVSVTGQLSASHFSMFSGLSLLRSYLELIFPNPISGYLTSSLELTDLITDKYISHYNAN